MYEYLGHQTSARRTNAFLALSIVLIPNITEVVGKEWQCCQYVLRGCSLFFIGNDLHIEKRSQNANAISIVRKTS